jgi:hypothetical protein
MKNISPFESAWNKFRAKRLEDIETGPEYEAAYDAFVSAWGQGIEFACKQISWDVAKASGMPECLEVAQEEET